ncbi:MAG: S-layer homology domain-containing protein [Acutalibacter sp.]
MERILSGLMAIALVLLLLPTTQADSAEPGFDDVAGLPCEAAAEALYQTGIVSGTAPHIFAPNSTLTRAQMATILVRAYAQEVAGEGKNFDDVPESHWAYSYIASASALGLIYGVSDTRFAPESDVTLEQCVTMLVHVWGYDTEAENFGGYPQGYLEVGKGLGLLNEVTEQQGDAPLTRGDMAILVCNSLGLGEANQARLLYQGQGSIRIVTPEGKVIYIDPYAGTGYDLPADLILVTHNDPDHNKVAKVALRSEDCRIITQDEALADGVHQTFDLGYATVQAVEAGYNDNHDVTECVGYVITLSDGVSVYVSGDTSTTEQMPEMASWGIDYAFFCCDGAFNMGTAEASQCAALVGAAHSIPYHTKASPADPDFDLEKAMEFQAEGRLLVDMGQEIVLVRDDAAPAATLTENTFQASDGSTLSYWLYTPENAAPGMPMLLYLHGGTGRGTDLELVMDGGFSKYLRDGLLGDVPAYIVMPQLTAGRWSADTETIYELTSELAAQFQIDLNGISLTGHSLGGSGAWELAAAFSGFFSRVAPLSGAVFPTEENLAALSQTEVWAFVGSADTVIEPAYTLDFAQQLGNSHTSLTVTVLEGADHFDVPCLAYLGESHDLLQWLIQ